jgi:predicted MFS family arabinose efflux permease
MYKNVNMKKISLDTYFLRNALGVSLSEFFWGIGIPILLESTFLQLFLAGQGASNTVIGFSGTIFSVSISIMPLFAAFFASGFQRKKMLVIVIHLFPSAAILLLGLFYFVFGAKYNTITVFLVFFLVFSITLGFTMPVWQNYIVKIFTPAKRLQGLSFMMISQNGAKLLSGIIIAGIIASFGMTLRISAYLFICTGIVFVIGSLLYFITYEQSDSKPDVEIRHPLHYVKHHIKHIFKNKPMLWYIVHDIEFFAIVTVFSFYARYATEHKGISASDAGGIFVILAFAGAVSANILFGFIWSGHIKNKLYFAKVCSFAGILLLVIHPAPYIFLMVSFLLGFSRGARFILYTSAVKLLSGLEDASSYYAIIPLITIIVSGGFPLLAGRSIDFLGFLGGDAYRITFILYLLIVLTGFFALKQTVFPEESASGK